MKHRTILRMFSSVGGGPLERMTRELKKNGENARLCASLSPEQWRAFFHHGKAGRLAARALTFGWYPIQAFGAALAASLSARPLERPILVASTNPFFLPHFLVATKKLHRCGVVPLMYDMYPDALEAAGVEKKLLSKVMTAANRWMLQRADGVVYIGDVMRESSERRYATNAKTYVIPNGASREEFDLSDRPSVLDDELKNWMAGRTIFSYVGNMGLMHDVETLEKAVPAIIEFLDEESRAGIGFIIAATGPGEARLRESWKDLTDNVRFIGPQGDAAWAELLVMTDAAFATLTEQAHATSVPSKIYSAIAAGCIPVAVAPDTSDLARFIQSLGCVVKPGDVDGLVHTMLQLHQDLQENTENAEKWYHQVLGAALENDIESIGERWMECINAVKEDIPDAWKTVIYHVIKRGFDIASVSAGLAVIWPVLAATAVAVRIKLGAPVLFRQQRPGIDGKPFELLKFRSMANAPADTDASHDGERLSDFGRKIRALSLDELPTLLNVLRGDMSLVGPRPLLMSYLERYSEEQMKRQWVRPGVTGWAQCNGRNALSWEEKFAYDVWYVENASLMLDLKILLKTAMTVLKRSGIEHANSATMPEFMGNVKS